MIADSGLGKPGSDGSYYPGVKIGNLVRLIKTTDLYTHLKPGTLGRVQDVTKMPSYEGNKEVYQIWISWYDGSKLGLIPSSGDEFEVIKE